MKPHLLTSTSALQAGGAKRSVSAPIPALLAGTRNAQYVSASTSRANEATGRANQSRTSNHFHEAGKLGVFICSPIVATWGAQTWRAEELIYTSLHLHRAAGNHNDCDFCLCCFWNLVFLR